MNHTLQSLALLVFTAGIASAQQAAAPVTVDAKLPDYAVASGVSGNLNSVGSDTLNNLMTFWAEGFKAKYPNVNTQVEGKGSGTAPPALTSGAAQVGPMSREMKSSESASFAGKFGYKPTKIPVAIDALAVFVHKDNDLKGLSSPRSTESSPRPASVAVRTSPPGGRSVRPAPSPARPSPPSAVIPPPEPTASSRTTP